MTIPLSISLSIPLSISGACTACGACLVTCPEQALQRAAYRPALDAAACTSCWACIEICPADAISVSPFGAPDWSPT